MIALLAGCARGQATVEEDGVRWFEGTCDASAAVAVGDRWVVAGDEDDVLRVYDPTRGGAPVVSLGLSALFGVSAERDLEAVAVLGDEAWWVGSHGRKKGGDEAPDRAVVLPTRLSWDGTHVGIRAVGPLQKDLLDRLSQAPGVSDWLGPASTLPPKTAGGLNIEGAARTADGTLWIGFRGPLDADGRARVVALTPQGGGVHALDLRGRGVRDLVVQGSDLMVLAGAVTAADEGFAIYRWSPPEGAAQHVVNVPSGLRAEAIVPTATGWWVLSDDGALETNGQACKDRDTADQRFRANHIVQ